MILLSVGISIAAILILGVAVYFSNRKNITNKSFLYLAVAVSFWSTFNYLNYQSDSPQIVLAFLRLLMFSSVWFAFTLFQLLYVFPRSEVLFPKFYKTILTPLSILISLSALTPAIFKSIDGGVTIGTVARVNEGWGIIPFAILVLYLVGYGIYLFVKKTIQAHGTEKGQFKIVLIGIILTFSLVIILNFLLPAFFNLYNFIPLGAVFIFPFIAFTAYAIYRHKLFNIKNITTFTFAFALTVTSFIEIIFANTLSLVIFRISVFILVLIFSIRMVGDMFKIEFANERLKELDALKNEFVSLATHQIRAPLTAIKGYISLVQEGDYGPVSPEIAQALTIIMSSTNNLVTIVGDFLDVSRIEGGKMKYDYSDFDIEKLAEEVISEYRPNVEKRGLALEFTFEQNKNYMVHADKGKVKQVIGNILDNSIKYTPHGNIKVNVSISEQSGKSIIKISDTGVGIPATTMPKLFQKFSRAENANETNILGTGLGLYIARNMIESMSGRVWAESEGANTGSQFYIEIPVKTS